MDSVIDAVVARFLRKVTFAAPFLSNDFAFGSSHTISDSFSSKSFLSAFLGDFRRSNCRLDTLKRDLYFSECLGAVENISIFYNNVCMNNCDNTLAKHELAMVTHGKQVKRWIST